MTIQGHEGGLGVRARAEVGERAEIGIGALDFTSASWSSSYLMRSLWTLEIGIGLVLGLVLGLRLVLGVDAIMVLLEGHG